jgi:hypothetical protein
MEPFFDPEGGSPLYPSHSCRGRTTPFLVSKMGDGLQPAPLGGLFALAILTNAEAAQRFVRAARAR